MPGKRDQIHEKAYDPFSATSAVTGYDDSQLDLVDAMDPNGNIVPMGLISPSQGQVQTAVYSGWAFDGQAGIAANGSSIVSGGPSAPNGSQAGYLQDLSVISQTIGGWSAGTYTLNFESAVIPGTNSSQNEQLQVFVDDTPITFSSSTTLALGTSYSSYTSDSFTVPAGVHQIRFVGLGDTTMGTAMIDQVSVSGSGAPAVLDGSFEGDSLGSGNSAINPIAYALTAASSAGGIVAGKMSEAFIQQGQNATPIPQESLSYYAHTAGSTTTFPLASDTVYGNTDGTDARTTSYSYGYFSGTNAIQSETTIAPPITSSQNGPATSSSDTADADTTTDVYDPEGRVIWARDGGGNINYTAYDDLSGGVGKFIEAVNTADTGEFSNLPSGWRSPAGTALNFVTTYQVDALGRTTEQTDPNGNITYTVYNDVGHETRVYPGWHEVGSTWTTTGPIRVTREYWPAAGSGSPTVYDETLTSSATPTVNGSNQPTGQETIGSSNIQSLSRSITNDAGQMVEEDDYFSLSGVTYSQGTIYLGTASNDSSTGNYSATTYHYNARGWQDIVTDPTRTITRKVYDYLGRVVSTWVGTSDTPASGYWSPTNNTSPSNMVDVQDNYYDQRQAAPAAPSVGQTSSGGPYTYAETLLVEITYVTAAGESDPSQVVSYMLNGGDLLTVASPASVPGATGYNVYVGIATPYVYDATLPMLQNSSPIPIGTNWTMASGGVAAGPSVVGVGVGDSNLTETVQHPGGGAADRVTLNLYNWRDELIATKQGALLDSNGNPNPSSETDAAHRLITYMTYDNLGEPTASRTYAADGVSLTDFATWTSSTDASDLRAYSTKTYDDQGRVYLAQIFSVDPTSGTVGASLATNTYYDHRGNVIETSAPGGIVTKHTYDAANRDTKDSTTDGGALNNGGAPLTDWADAGTTANDVVIEQTLNTYDHDGSLVQTEDEQRFDNDATTSTGDLGSPSFGISARDYFTDYYYDAAGRLTDAVNIGTNGGAGWSRPSAVPADSDTVLVNHTDYNSAGWVLDTVDPRGIMAATFYDMLGRTIKTIAAWDGTQTATPTNDTNRSTTYTYDGDGNVLTQAAVMPSGTNSQTTAYLYGTTSTSGVYSNDLLAKVEYPDPSTGAASTSSANDESFTYNALGQRTSYTDRNGTTHAYTYGVLGRLTADDISAFGSGVSTQTYGLAYSFNSVGLPFQQTSYSNSGLSTVENQVEDVYNGYGQLITQYQADTGAVSIGSTPSVQYGCSQPTGANYSRLTSMTYPNGRVEDYGYNSGIDSTISRISTIVDSGGTDAGTVAAYTYLGLSTIVQESQPQINTELTYINQSGDAHALTDGGDRYTGLDRFGRVDDQWYLNTSTSATLDRLQYGYDRGGNVLYENNLVNGSFSELYHANSGTSGDNNSAYDPLSRLTGFRRGTLTSSGNNGATLDTITTANLNSTASVPNQNSWSLDALGNWNSGAGLSNTFNSQNEETANGSNTLTYDNDGNMTTDQAGNKYTWDAWGHAVRIASSANVTEEVFTYDALGRAVTNNNGSGNEDRYFSGTNVIQEQFASTYTQFVYGLAYVNDVILRDRNADGNVSTGNLGITGTGMEEREYEQHDKQFSAISLTDASGNIIQRYVYDPYGTTTLLTASWAYDTTGGGTNYWLYTFQGMRIVDCPGTSGVFFSQTRIYDATLGRWISQDWGGYSDTANMYQFVDGSPGNLVDPAGRGGVSPANPANGFFGIPSFPSTPVTPEQLRGLPEPPPIPSTDRPNVKLFCTDFFYPRSKFDNWAGDNIFSGFNWLQNNIGVDGFYIMAGPQEQELGDAVDAQIGLGFQWSLTDGWYVGGESYGGNSGAPWGMVGGWYGYSGDYGWDPNPLADPGNSSGGFVGIGPLEWGTQRNGTVTFYGLNIDELNFGFVGHPCCSHTPGAPPPATPVPPPPPPLPWWKKIFTYF